MKTDETVKPDWRAVRWDRKIDYNFSESDSALIERVFEVYAYDKNLHTHLCEFAPSYWCVFLYSYIVMADGTTEDDLERLNRMLDDCEHDNIYVHVSRIDALPDADKASFGEIPDDIDNPEEHVREHWVGNWPL